MKNGKLIIQGFEYKITISYLLIGFLWIFLSDTLFDSVVSDKLLLTKLNIAKGFFYMIATSFLLFFFVKRQMKRLQKAKAHAEESNRLKSAFLANMSHEIRTPMNGILGFAELLSEPGLSGEEQQECIEIIEKSGHRMLNIINDIIDISKIESGLMFLDVKEVNVNDKIKSIYTFFKPEVENKGMCLICEKVLAPEDSIGYTDSGKLDSILSNLIKNAIKFTDEGYVEFGCVKKGVCLEFFVKDSGIGIPKDRQDAVFERFVQADVADRMAKQGAGLGLSISKAYVEMLGGRIWLESEEGQGAVFYFTIPFKVKAQVKKQMEKGFSEPEVGPQLGGLKILIAEDDEVSEMLLEREMKRFSHEVLKAHHGAEAVEICRNNPDIDLVMMDVKMPVMSGIEAIRKIRTFDKRVVVIAQTAYALSGERELIMDAGADDYISKPIVKDALHQIMQKHFMNKR